MVVVRRAALLLALFCLEGVLCGRLVLRRRGRVEGGVCTVERGLYDAEHALVVLKELIVLWMPVRSWLRREGGGEAREEGGGEVTRRPAGVSGRYRHLSRRLGGC